MDPYAGISAALVMAGVPAVVAMQFPISDRAAIEFTNCLYPRLAQGYPLDSAIAEARKAIRIADRKSLEWATPVLFMRTPDGRLFDIPGSEAEASQTARPALAGQHGAVPPVTPGPASAERPSDVPERTARTRGRQRLLGGGVAIITLAVAVIAWRFFGAGEGVSLSSVPTAAEHSRFIAAADAATVSDSDIEAMTIAPLRMALEMKLRAADQAWNELDDQVERLDAEASAGSADAAVALYLASQIDSLGDYLQGKGLSPDSFVPYLEVASDNGDALAMYWYALNLRRELLGRQGAGEISASDTQFLAYCDLLEDAADRGMNEIARTPARTDQCP
jgi:hypothetical protein